MVVAKRNPGGGEPSGETRFGEADATARPAPIARALAGKSLRRAAPAA